MNTLVLHNHLHLETTAVSNHFIDGYMPSANGSFVKVYLYLLRHSAGIKELSISIIADELDETEKDIMRALRYWDEKQLLSIHLNEQAQVTDIAILDFYKASQPLHQKPVEETSAAHTPVRETKKPAGGIKEMPKPNYSDAQIRVLTEIDDVKWMMSALEQYLERMLKPADVQLVLYLYEGLCFSTELILYLYEYCVSMNKKNASYIEAVALSWAESGIDTVEKAEASTAIYHAGYQTVSKAFGLNRTLSEIERKFITRWFEHYKFDNSIIQEACGRTILSAGKPDFKYADKILENWHKRGVKSSLDIEKLDDEHQKRINISKKNIQQAASPPASSPGNRFNSFPQRQHDKEYYDTLEKRLLEKSLLKQ